MRASRDADRRRRRWRGSCALAALAVSLAACGGVGSPSVDDVPGENDPGSVAAGDIAPRCAELEDQPYSPPAEEQPAADPSLTGAAPTADIAPVDGDGTTEEIPATDPMNALREWAEREAAHHYAGMWIDNEEGAAVVAFTDEVERYAEEVRSRFGAGWWVVEHEHSLADLGEVQDALTPELGRWDGDVPGPGDVYGTGRRDPINRVTVAIVEPDAERVTELSERYGADRICFEIEALPTSEDAVPSPWEPAPGEDLDPSSTSIDVLVVELNCASGEPADGRIPAPDVEYGDEEIVITIGVVPRPGGQECQGNPPTPFTVELEEPLGGRALLDGSVDPPAEPDLDRELGE